MLARGKQRGRRSTSSPRPWRSSGSSRCLRRTRPRPSVRPSSSSTASSTAPGRAREHDVHRLGAGRSRASSRLASNACGRPARSTSRSRPSPTSAGGCCTTSRTCSPCLLPGGGAPPSSRLRRPGWPRPESTRGPERPRGCLSETGSAGSRRASRSSRRTSLPRPWRSSEGLRSSSSTTALSPGGSIEPVRAAAGDAGAFGGAHQGPPARNSGSRDGGRAAQLASLATVRQPASGRRCPRSKPSRGSAIPRRRCPLRELALLRDLITIGATPGHPRRPPDPASGPSASTSRRWTFDRTAPSTTRA